MTTPSSTEAPPEAPPAAPPAAPEPKPETDWQAEHQKVQAEARKWEQRAKDNNAKAKKLDEMQAASATEQDKAVEAARAEATASANARILRSEVKAAAAALGFHDPSDALGSADLSQFTADENGDFDSAAIASALKDVLKAKPYLAKQAQTQPPAPGNPGFGTGGVRTGTAQDIANRLAAAEKSGDWKTAVALKTAGMFGTSPQT